MALFDSTKKKVVALAVTGTFLVSGSIAFGASPMLGNVQDYLQGVLGSEQTELTTQANTTQSTAVTDIETFLTGLKNRIGTELGTWNDTEKQRAQTEINDYNAQLQTEADTQATTDITNGKSQLTNTANTEIQEAKSALDAKYQEIFPAPTTTTTP